MIGEPSSPSLHKWKLSEADQCLLDCVGCGTYLDRKRETLERWREIRRVSSGSLPRLQEVIFVDEGTLWLEHFEEDADEIWFRDSQRQFRCGASCREAGLWTCSRLLTSGVSWFIASCCC